MLTLFGQLSVNLFWLLFSFLVTLSINQKYVIEKSVVNENSAHFNDLLRRPFQAAEKLLSFEKLDRLRISLWDAILLPFAAAAPTWLPINEWCIPWRLLRSSGYGIRLVILWLLVWIPAPYTGWTFFNINLL